MKPEWDQPIKMVNGKPDWPSIFETKCKMGATSYSEYSGDKEMRQSVFGWNLYFMGALIAHKSKSCKVANVGAIYLAKNFSLSQNTKHIDIRRHFVW
jgi:hypothetical protein